MNKDTILAEVEEQGLFEIERTLLLQMFPGPNPEEAISEFFERNGLHATKLAGDIILITRKRRQEDCIADS